MRYGKSRRGCLPGLLGTIGVALMFGQAAPASEDEVGVEEGFVRLFDGESLQGWTPIESAPGNWKVVGGLLVTEGQGGGWLSTNAEYGDFELRLEYRLKPGGNSGVFIRAPREGLPWLTGMEIQILDDDADVYTSLMPAQYCGSVYGVVPAQRGRIRPAGEWNTMAIRAEGPRIEVRLNGSTVVDADLTKYPESVQEHPGINRRSGYIGLQSHSEPVEFRNVRIRVRP